MTENETNTGDEAENSDENNENADDLQELVQQAREFHTMMDQMKRWSKDTMEVLLKGFPDPDDPDAEQYEQAYALVVSVQNRIEEGDLARSRRP